MKLPKELIKRINEIREEMLSQEDFNDQYQEAKDLLLNTLGVDDIDPLISWFDTEKEGYLIISMNNLERVLSNHFGDKMVNQLGAFGTLTFNFGEEITDNFKNIVHSGWVERHNKIKIKCNDWEVDHSNGFYTVSLPYLKKCLSEEDYVEFVSYLQYLHGAAVLDAIYNIDDDIVFDEIDDEDD